MEYREGQTRREEESNGRKERGEKKKKSPGGRVDVEGGAGHPSLGRVVFEGRCRGEWGQKSFVSSINMPTLTVKECQSVTHLSKTLSLSIVFSLLITLTMSFSCFLFLPFSLFLTLSLSQMDNTHVTRPLHHVIHQWVTEQATGRDVRGAGVIIATERVEEKLLTNRHMLVM